MTRKAKQLHRTFVGRYAAPLGRFNALVGLKADLHFEQVIHCGFQVHGFDWFMH